MTNPASAKPSAAVYNPSATFGANLQAQVPFTEGSGPPLEVKSQYPAQPTISGIAASNVGLAVAGYTLQAHSGGPPAWNPGGLTIGGTNYGPSVKFDHSTRPLFFGGNGFPTSNSQGVTGPRTLSVIFKHAITCYNRAGVKANYNLVSSGGNGATALVLANDAPGSIPTDKLRLQFSTQNNANTDPIIPLECLPGRWYAAALVVGMKSGTTSTKTFYLYDLTNQVLHPGSGVTMVDANLGYLDSNIFNIGGPCLGTENPFIGEVADAGLHNEAWAASDFANYCSDPWSAMRGTYTPSGPLTSANGRTWDQGTTTLTLGFPRFTGVGTGGGTGAPTYTAYRAALPTIAAGAAGSTLVSGVTNTGGTIVVADTGLSLASDYWYTLVASDGTQTLSGNPLFGRTRSKAPLVVGIIGDSKEYITGVPEATCAAAIADNRRLTLVNWARPSGGLTGPAAGNPLNYSIGNAIAASNQAVSLSYQNGSATGGTFNLIFPFATPIAVSGLAWNITPAALQAAINAALTGGTVACAGAATLNAGAITITGATGAYQYASWPLPAFDLAGSALTGTTSTVAGEPVAIGTAHTVSYNPGTTANSLYTTARAEFARVGVTSVYLQHGANDTPTSAWQSALSAMIADLMSAGYAVVVRPVQSKHNASTLNAPDPVADATQYGFQQYVLAAAAANPGCKVAATNSYGWSAVEMNQFTYVDGLHELANSAFGAAVGIAQYNEMTAAFDPQAAASAGASYAFAS